MKYSQTNRWIKWTLFSGLWLVAVSVSTRSYAQATAEYNCQEHVSSVIDAARNGKLPILETYQQADCVLPNQDARGFTLYDLAALNGDEEMMRWLVEIGYIEQGRYSVQLYKLIQTGLRFLNFDAGVIDGKKNAATAEGVMDFQKANKLKQTGEVSPEWLGFFNRKLTSKTQRILESLGFSAGGADGIIGPNTRTAMKAFRQERSMPQGDYGYIDDQLLYQIMMAENEATKQEIARREADRAARIKAQQAAQRQEIAKRRAQAQKEAEKARRQAEAAAKEAQAQRIANEKALREEQARLAVQAEQRQSVNNSTAQVSTPQTQQALQAKQAKIKAEQEAERIAAEKRAQILAQRQAELASKAAEEKRRAEELAKAKAQTARRAEEMAKAKALAAQKEASEARNQAQQAFKAARSGQSVPVSPDVQVGQPIKSQPSTALKPGGGFNQLSGKLKFVRNGGKLSQCLIDNQTIDNAWCEPYYPSGENKQCEAIVSRTGIVVSLLCK